MNRYSVKHILGRLLSLYILLTMGIISAHATIPAYCNEKLPEYDATYSPEYPREQLAKLIQAKVKSYLYKNLIETISIFHDTPDTHKDNPWSHISKVKQLLIRQGYSKDSINDELDRLNCVFYRDNEFNNGDLRKQFREKTILKLIQAALVLLKIDRQIYLLDEERKILESLEMGATIHALTASGDIHAKNASQLPMSILAIGLVDPGFKHREELFEKYYHGNATRVEQKVFDELLALDFLLPVSDRKLISLKQTADELNNVRQQFIDLNPLLKIDKFYIDAARIGKAMIRDVIRYTNIRRSSSRLTLNPDALIQIDALQLGFLIFRKSETVAPYSAKSMKENRWVYDPVDVYSEKGLDYHEEDQLDYFAFANRIDRDTSLTTYFFKKIGLHIPTPDDYINIIASDLDTHIDARLHITRNNIANQLYKVLTSSNGELFDLLRFQEIQSMMIELVKNETQNNGLTKELKNQIRRVTSKFHGTYKYMVVIGAGIILGAIFPPAGAIILAGVTVIECAMTGYDLYQSNAALHDTYEKRNSSVIGMALASEFEYRAAIFSVQLNTIALLVSGAFAIGTVTVALKSAIKAGGLSALRIAAKESGLSFGKSVAARTPNFIKNPIRLYIENLKFNFKTYIKWMVGSVAVNSMAECLFRGVDGGNRFDVKKMGFVENSNVTNSCVYFDDDGNFQVNQQVAITTANLAVAVMIWGPVAGMYMGNPASAGLLARAKAMLPGIPKRFLVGLVLTTATTVTTQSILHAVKYGYPDVDSKRAAFDVGYRVIAHPSDEPDYLLRNATKGAWYHMPVYMTVAAIKTFIHTAIKTDPLNYMFGNDCNNWISDMQNGERRAKCREEYYHVAMKDIMETDYDIDAVMVEGDIEGKTLAMLEEIAVMLNTPNDDVIMWKEGIRLTNKEIQRSLINHTFGTGTNF